MNVCYQGSAVMTSVQLRVFPKKIDCTCLVEDSSLRLLFVLATEHTSLHMFLNIWRQILFLRDQDDAAVQNFMAHSTVWGHPPIQRQNTHSKKLTTEKFLKSGLRRCTKFGQAHSNDEQKITLSLILYFIWDFRI